MEATTTEAQRAAPPPRLRDRYRERGRRAADRQVRLPQPDGGPTAREGHAQHGRRRRQADDLGARGGDRAARGDLGPAPERAARPQVDRLVQGSRRDAGRGRRDPPRGADVGVRRPADLDRDSAHPRLPRAQPPLVRRARQLLAGHPRAADLSGDRLRLDRRGARAGRDDHDQRARPTRRPSSCCSRSDSRSRRRAGRARSTTRPRRRSGAARRRASAPRPRQPLSSSSRRRTPRPTPSASGPRRRARRAMKESRPRPRRRRSEEIRGCSRGSEESK